MKIVRLLPLLVVVLSVTACGGSDRSGTGTPESSVASTSVVAVTAAPIPVSESAAPEPAPEEAAPVTTEQPLTQETEMVEDPYIVDCQMGLGPVITYWSDGTVTGYSDYCQSIHDQVLQDEVAANTPVCDGTICRYPSGATRPDTESAPRTPSPWVQGQLDWQVCKEAGNTDEYCRANS